MNPESLALDNPTVQRAPGAQVCCDPAGRLCALAVQPVPLSTLIRVAVARGEGTEPQLRARVDDMLAGGLLIELGD
jgi:hypothetical protein